jgi:GNAT superfamily N-acetyltransferase
MQVRRFVEADLGDVKRLVDDTIDASYAGAYSPAAIAFFKEYHSRQAILDDAAAGYTLVVENDGVLLATGTLIGTNVRRMFVSPSEQSHGLGNKLLSGLEEHARTLGLAALDLSSSIPALGFYLHHGYRIESEESISLPGGDTLPYYAMSKTLHQ